MKERDTIMSCEYYSTISPVASAFLTDDIIAEPGRDPNYEIFPLELLDSECCSCPRNFVKAYQILK